VKLTGVVLAGGKSTRFGSDKASALLRGRPLLQWMVDAVTAECAPLVVVRAPGQELPALAWAPAPVLVVEDFAAEQGPVAGLISGLRAAKTAAAFVTSCDAPLLRTAVIRGLGEALGESEAAVPRVDGRAQPLLAVYRVAPALRALEAAYQSGERRLIAALAPLQTAWLDDDALRRLDPDLASFRNANRPETLAEIEAVLAASGQ
jgi:molybdopterin-guanine dinucleotide biosynthesis protein A